ncbi:hypothetical protein DFH09DRAFT_494055 [Mycena vulgaris]|nr:hypothetical protein DFH09DRAFT_494055 [Mycena vulgaris]
MLEACSRMHEMACMWFACGCVLNSLENLITHLHEVHAQEDDDELCTCMWDICGESFADWRQLAAHAEMHVLGSIYCAHEDCDAVLRSPRELVAHNLGHAEENSALKPSTRPSAPPQEALPLPIVPASVPTSMLLAPAVQMPPISMERHLTLGPWVLRNICAPANVRARRYNAAVPLRAAGGKGLQPDYEFLETSAMHYSCFSSRPAKVREMADLNSKEVSDLLGRGQLVLWPAGGGAHQFDVKPADEEEMAVENMLQVDEEVVEVDEEQVEVDEEQVKVDGEQVKVEEEQVEEQAEADEEQVEVNEEQVEVDEEQVEVNEEQMEVDEEQVEVDEEQVEVDEEQVKVDGEQVKVEEQVEEEQVEEEQVEEEQVDEEAPVQLATEIPGENPLQVDEAIPLQQAKDILAETIDPGKGESMQVDSGKDSATEIHSQNVA